MKQTNSGLYDRVNFSLEKLRKDLISCNKTLAKLPAGSLVSLKKKNHYEYYHCIGKKQKYLNSKNTNLIEALASKKYLRNFKRFAQNEIKSLEAYLKIKDASIPSPYEYLSNHEELSIFLNKKIFKGKKNFVDWAKAPYDQQQLFPEGLKIHTAQGHLVRSKSEYIIANALYAEGITYRYEEPLDINGKTFYPDFTIRKFNGDLIIWEHLGMMDVEEYVNKNIQKITNYIRAGFIPGINLILTADEKSGTIIDTYKVQKIIEGYLLQ